MARIAIFTFFIFVFVNSCCLNFIVRITIAHCEYSSATNEVMLIKNSFILVLSFFSSDSLPRLPVVAGVLSDAFICHHRATDNNGPCRAELLSDKL